MLDFLIFKISLIVTFFSIIKNNDDNLKQLIRPPPFFPRFLSTGISFTALAHSYRMGVSTVSYIVEETTSVIWRKLKPVFLPTPTVKSLQEIAKKYYSKCNFPNVIGAIDDKHIRIRCPANSGSDF